MKTQELTTYLNKEKFNVYNLEYTNDFKENLPIDWDKWANKDLTNIPSKFHILFRTDWNWGPFSKMEMSDRIHLHELYLEYIKWTNKNLDNGI